MTAASAMMPSTCDALGRAAPRRHRPLVGATARPRAMRCTASGISHAPGTRTIVMFASSPPWRTMRVDRALDEAIDDEVVEAARDDREPRPLGDDEVALDDARAETAMFSPDSRSSSALAERDALDDLEAEAGEPGDLTRVVREQADLVQAEVGEDLRADAELAERAVGGAGAGSSAGGARRAA